MKKTIAIVMVGMFVLVGCGSAVIGEDDESVSSNRPPKAPVFVGELSDWEKESYRYTFYAEDPDGDAVYYETTWKKVGESNIVSCSPDDPVSWLGPFESGVKIDKIQNFQKSGTYELTIRAKDIHNSVGPSTTVTVTYKSSISQFPLLLKLMEKFPEIFNILEKIF